MIRQYDWPVQVITIFASVAWLSNAYIDLYFIGRLSDRDFKKYGEQTRPGWNTAGRIFLVAATFAIVAAIYDSNVLLQISVYIAIVGFLTPWIDRRFVLKDQPRLDKE